MAVDTVTLTANGHYYAIKGTHPTGFAPIPITEDSDFGGGTLKVRYCLTDVETNEPDLNNGCIVERDALGNELVIGYDQVYKCGLVPNQKVPAWIVFTVQNATSPSIVIVVDPDSTNYIVNNS